MLGKYTTESALALCDVIVSLLNNTLRSDDGVFLGRRPPVGIDWMKVYLAVKDRAALQSPLECQRLWKYVAYGIDVGELACLADDSDDEAMSSLKLRRK